MPTKPKKPVNRLKISDGIVNSCQCFTNRDYMTAFLWASKVMKIVGKNHHLTNDEARYINEVITKYSNKNN